MSGTVPDKVLLLLRMMRAAGGEIDATDDNHSLLNYFCDDDEFGETDTFNKAIELGLIRTTHHDIFETSRAYLTDTGRAAAQRDMEAGR